MDGWMVSSLFVIKWGLGEALLGGLISHAADPFGRTEERAPQDRTCTCDIYSTP